MADEPNKYVVFKRNEFFEMMGYLALPPWTNADGSLVGVDMDAAPLGEQILREVTQTELADAVVIRRQDLFASPCLATYASMISLVASNISDKAQAKELQRIADYFEDQANLAAAEGYKLPDV